MLAELHDDVKRGTQDFEAAQGMEDRTGKDVLKNQFMRIFPGVRQQIDPAAAQEGLLETDPRYKILQGLPIMEDMMKKIWAQQALRESHAQKRTRKASR